MSVVRTSAVFGRRACALLAVCSAALHGVLLAHSGTPAMAAVMAVMMVACLYCARDLWLRGALGVWCAVALMNLAMVAVHTPIPVHHHGGAAATTHASATMTVATSLALLEVLIAAAVLAYRTHQRSVF